MVDHTQERLEHCLELQALQIEEILARHNMSVTVTGGKVEPGQTIFEARIQSPTGSFIGRQALPPRLKQELVDTLNIQEVSLRRQEDSLLINLRLPAQNPVDLQALMDSISDGQSMTAVLGLSDDKRPVLLNMLAPDTANLLITGGPQAGKSGLLQSIILSLALKNKQSLFQTVIIATREDQRNVPKKGLYPLNYLPHLLLPVVTTLKDATKALAFLVDEMVYRLEQRCSQPLVLLAVDDLDVLLEDGGQAILHPLIRLLQDGTEAGIRLVLCSRQPTRPLFNKIMKCNLPVRLVGQVEDWRIARAVSGLADTGAEHLLGQGDFVATANGMVVHFQAAAIGDYDLHWALDRLHRQKRPVMVARSRSVRPHFRPPTQTPGEAIAFTFAGDDGTIAFVSPKKEKKGHESVASHIPSTGRAYHHLG